jgi:hypothetical protein
MITCAPDSTPTASASSVAVSQACRARTMSGAGRPRVGNSLIAAGPRSEQEYRQQETPGASLSSVQMSPG